MRINFNDICVHTTVSLFILKITGLLPINYLEVFAPIGLLIISSILAYTYLALTIKAKLIALASKQDKEE